MIKEQATDQSAPEEYNAKATFIRLFVISTALSIGIALVFLLITFAGFGFFQFRKINKAMTEGGLPLTEAYSQIKQGWAQPPTSTDNRKNILILGLDRLETRSNDPDLTDSLMIASLNLESGEINLLSIPRDLWSDEYQTKINALYVYGAERYPEEPEKFTQEVIEGMTGIEIHHTLVISIQDLKEIIDSLGGIEVEIPVSFVDERFPNPDVNVNQVTDPNILYKTVSFSQGIEQMDGQRAMEYVRSRYSSDDSGTDLDRSMRQRLIIESIANKLLNRDTFTDSQKLTKLTAIYTQKFQQKLPITELAATAKSLLPVRQNISIRSWGLSIYPDQEDGVITHPPLYNTSLYNGQWVYIIRDNEQFNNYITDRLDL